MKVENLSVLILVFIFTIFIIPEWAFAQTTAPPPPDLPNAPAPTPLPGIIILAATGVSYACYKLRKKE